MDRVEVVKTLKEQSSEPFAQAVEKKLAYLQSDDVFTEQAPEDTYFGTEDENEIDMAFEDAFNSVETIDDAFNMTSDEHSAPQPTYTQQTAEPAAQPTSQTNTASVQNEAAQSSQSMAARIAALRGISLPGDYMRKK